MLVIIILERKVNHLWDSFELFLIQLWEFTYYVTLINPYNEIDLPKSV